MFTNRRSCNGRSWWWNSWMFRNNTFRLSDRTFWFSEIERGIQRWCSNWRNLFFLFGSPFSVFDWRILCYWRRGLCSNSLLPFSFFREFKSNFLRRSLHSNVILSNQIFTKFRESYIFMNIVMMTLYCKFVTSLLSLWKQYFLFHKHIKQTVEVYFLELGEIATFSLAPAFFLAWRSENHSEIELYHKNWIGT